MKFLIVILACAGLSCSSDAGPEIVARHYVEDLAGYVSLKGRVFWEPLDTVSLRKLIRETPLVKDKTVLEIGTGSGLLSLYALNCGATKVVATDVNPDAVASARYNADEVGFPGTFEARLVPLTQTEAFSTIEDSETFDVILSNPPWVDRRPANINEYALYDEGFQLMRTLLEGLDEHLNPGGRVLLSYGSVEAIETLVGMASEMGLTVRLLADGRDVSRLPREEFLPGLLVEITDR